jgi:hypothetical protein
MKGNLEKALAGSDPEKITENILDIERRGQDQVIDYHIILKQGGRCSIGDSVIGCSYVQMQQTNSCTAVVDGIHRDKPELLAIFDRGVRPVGKDYMPLPVDGVIEMIKGI